MGAETNHKIRGVIDLINEKARLTTAMAGAQEEKETIIKPLHKLQNEYRKSITHLE